MSKVFIVDIGYVYRKVGRYSEEEIRDFGNEYDVDPTYSHDTSGILSWNDLSDQLKSNWIADNQIDDHDDEYEDDNLSAWIEIEQEIK